MNRKGFTLIELLAVITIMGILLLAGIPAISRIINNSRRDVFVDTAKKYVDAIHTRWTIDEIVCKKVGGEYMEVSRLPIGESEVYALLIDTKNESGTQDGIDAYKNARSLMDSGGRSPWSNQDIKGYIRIQNLGPKVGNKYYIQLIDESGRGIYNASDPVQSTKLKRANVSLKTNRNFSNIWTSMPTARCKIDD